MIINPFTAIVGGQQSNAIQKAGARLQAALAGLTSGAKVPADNVAELSLATQLQTSNSGARQALGNIALGLSVSQVADGGAEQIQNALQRLQAIAVQANSDTLDDAARKGLNEEFQGLISEITRISDGTQFGGAKLLDGSFSDASKLSLSSLLGEGEGAQDGLSLGDLSASALLGDTPLDVLSQENAAAALATISNALGTVTQQRTKIGSFTENLDFNSATLQSVLFNQEAARSELGDQDFAQASSALSLASNNENLAIALDAQAKRLPPSMLELLQW